MSCRLSKSDLFATLPTPWAENLRPQIRDSVAARPGHKLVVLDDDPTGTQTVHDVPVLTTWDVATLQREFATPGACFYVLTNSRSLTPECARQLAQQVGENLRHAASAADVRFTVVSRSDSTLRGHFAIEVEGLMGVLGPFDGVFVIPYFEAGGRYTIQDTHYVAEGDRLVPAAETPFARDAAFGFHNSDLRAYVEEKTGGRIRAEDVASVSIDDLRRGGPDQVAGKLATLSNGKVCVVNAAAPGDLDAFVAGLIMAETAGKRFLFRTAAQFVAARLGLEPQPLWSPDFKPGAWNANGLIAARQQGGLVIVGSYVPKTTEQLAHLEKSGAVVVWTLKVESILNDADREQAIRDAVFKLEFAYQRGGDVVLATSRELVTSADAATSLAIGNRVSAALVEIVQRLKVCPRYLIAKGGITSSDLAVKGLGVKRAIVRGQLLPGVPVWELGDETKFPGLPYIVFPGNVGGPEVLAHAIEILHSKPNP